MPTPTYDLIASNVLTSNASSVTFSSIPATYRDLIIAFQITGSTAADVGVRYNSDTGSNYSRIYAFGTGSVAVSAADTNVAIQRLAYMTTTRANVGLIQIFDYSATDKHKTALSKWGTLDLGTAMVAGRWANTNAITSVTLHAESGTLNSGSSFYLYGIAS